MKVLKFCSAKFCQSLSVNVPDNYSDCKHRLTSLMMYYCSHRSDLIFHKYFTPTGCSCSCSYLLWSMIQCRRGSLKYKTWFYLTMLVEPQYGLWMCITITGEIKGGITVYFVISYVQPFLIDMHCLLIGNNLLLFLRDFL